MRQESSHGQSRQEAPVLSLLAPHPHLCPFLPSTPTTQNKVPFVIQVAWAQVTRQPSYLNALFYSSSGVVSGSQLDLGGPLRTWNLPARKAVYEFLVSAVANHHKLLGGLKQQRFILSQFWKPESKFKVAQGCAPYQGSGR